MSFNDWDKVLADYQEVYIHSRYEEHAKGMLNLIPRIREDDAFMEVIPGTSHATLFLALPNKKTQVHVWCEQLASKYSVYLYNPEHRQSEMIMVNDGEIIPTLKSYIYKINQA